MFHKNISRGDYDFNVPPTEYHGVEADNLAPNGEEETNMKRRHHLPEVSGYANWKITCG